MKQFTYITGFLTSVTLVTGTLFKILQFPTANEILIIGIVGVAFVFFPFILVDRFKHLGNSVLSEKVEWVLGSLCMLTFGFGGVLKIQHMQGGAVLLGVSFLLFCVGFLPLHFFRMYKKSVDEL